MSDALPHARRVAAFFERFQADDLDMLGEVYAQDAAFKDPFNDVAGLPAIEGVYRHMFLTLDDPRFTELLGHFPDIDPTRNGLRAIIVVHAEHIRDTCGYAVPFMTYDEDRDLHGRRFEREDDAGLDAYFQKKEYIATSLDGLPGLPLPLPPATF